MNMDFNFPPTRVSSQSEKWLRLEQLDARLRVLDAEWEALVQERNELLVQRVQPLPAGRHMRLSFERAEARAIQVHALRTQGKTQRAIAAELGISRDMVARYLSPRNKAAIRAGLQQGTYI